MRAGNFAGDMAERAIGLTLVDIPSISEQHLMRDPVPAADQCRAKFDRSQRLAGQGSVAIEHDGKLSELANARRRQIGGTPDLQPVRDTERHQCGTDIGHLRPAELNPAFAQLCLRHFADRCEVICGAHDAHASPPVEAME